MKTIKSIMLISLLALVIGMCGCINIDIKQTIGKDGMSEMRMEYNLSGMLDIITEEELDEGKENFLSNTTWENAECEYVDGILVMTGTLDVSDVLEVRETDSGTLYKYDAKNVYNIFNDVAGEEDSISDETMSDSAMAEQMGISYTFTLTMPGEITSSTVGVIDGNTVVIDMFDLPGHEHAYVESREDNKSISGIGAFICIVIILGTVLYRKQQL